MSVCSTCPELILNVTDLKINLDLVFTVKLNFFKWGFLVYLPSLFFTPSSLFFLEESVMYVMEIIYPL